MKKLFSLTLFTIISLLATSTLAADKIVTNTEKVEDILVDGKTLWVASSGGVEQYDLDTHTRIAHYTTLDGLLSNHVLDLKKRDGNIVADGWEQQCELKSTRFTCKASPRRQVAIRQIGFRNGLRIVKEVKIDAYKKAVATFGDGVHIETDTGISKRLSVDNQICSNHVTDIKAFKKKRFFGSFDEGLCYESITERGVFHPVAAGGNRVNDLFVANGKLYLASNDGLHFTADGEKWNQVEGVPGATALAKDGRFLVVASTAAIRWVVLHNHRIRSAFWAPGGSTSIQDLLMTKDGTAFIATEDYGVVRIRHARLKSQREVHYFDRAAGAPSSWVLSIAETSDGSILAGTLKHGAFRIREDKIEEVNLNDEWLVRIRNRKGRIFYGTQGGATECIDGICSSIANLPDLRVHEFYLSRQHRYVATEMGLLISKI